MGAESTWYEVPRQAEWCQEAPSKVLDAIGKKITTCTHSKKWWNGEIKEKRSQLGREKRRRRRLAATAQAKAELQKSVRRAQYRICNDYLNNLRAAEVWRAAKFPRPWAGMTVEALTDRDRKQANMIAKKEEMLSRDSIPLNMYDQTFELPPQGQAHQSVTEHAVERALFGQSVQNALLLDQLSLGAVRLLWNWDTERIVELAKAAVRTG